MRIGLIGGVSAANYSLTRLLRERGHDASYLVDLRDTYPMSQPAWEDVAIELDPERAERTATADWDRLLAERGWRSPSWIRDVGGSAGRPPLRALGRSLALSGSLAPRLQPQLVGYLRANGSTVASLSRFDWLIVMGVRVVDAYLSGAPYTYWPHGGELRVLPYKDERPPDRFLARAISRAVGSARVAGTHDPTLAEQIERVGGRRDPLFLGYPVDTERYAPGPVAAPLAEEARRRAGGRKLVFLASRQDFHWKATDRFVRAFIRACAEGAELFLVMSPWGNDTRAVAAMLDEDDLAHAAWRLPALPSKPVLIDLYREADLVVDQFALGAYGTVMLEAMACGTPVMISLDVNAFTDRWPQYVPPPVVNAGVEGDIAAALLALDRGELPLEELGEQSRRWVLDVHGPSAVDRFLPQC